MSKNNYARIQSSIEKEDFDFLTEEGYGLSSIVRKIIHDWVAYKKISRVNPIKSIVEDAE